METALDHINAGWLTDRLHRNGYLPHGVVDSVQIKSGHKHHYELEVTYSDNASNSLPKKYILKWYDGEYRYGLREGFFYDQIAPAMNAPPVPKCYDVMVNWESKQSHILLEDLSATHYVASPPYGKLSREIMLDVCHAYLDIHAYWWDHPRIAQEDMFRVKGMGVAHEAISSKEVRENEQYFIEKVLPARTEQLGEKLPKKWHVTFEKVVESWADLFIQRIEKGTGLTLIQGDAQLRNVLLPRNPRRNRPVIIDWEGCTRGMGVWDLARTMIQTEMPSKRRKEIEGILLSSYHTGLLERGIKDYSREDCITDYRLSVLSNIPHAMMWETHSYLESALQAFQDWNCNEFLE